MRSGGCGGGLGWGEELGKGEVSFDLFDHFGG